MKYVGSTKTKFRQTFNVYKSHLRTYARKHGENSLYKGKPVPQAGFSVIFLKTDTTEIFGLGLKS